MKLFNTLTRQVEEFVPQEPGTAKVYTCGPTVYDYAHVGHWFNYVRMDILIRTLKLNDLKPTWVMNITDVGHLVSDADEGEDKLQKGARREGKTAWEIAVMYIQDFLQGMGELNILQPDFLPKATDHIEEQIALIEILEKKGYTYNIDDGVYYDTSKFEKYSDFAQLELDEQQATGRVVANPQKKQPSDFALWKFSPKGEKRDMEWASPWGKGFPGWHIECSAMSMKYLGETLDIHTGGIDHVPVHHTNEIAQSEAVTGKTFSNYWMHSNHVMVNGEKISKSLGNSIRLNDVTAKGISPMAFRLHILESHYRSHSHFSWDSLQAAKNRLQNIQNNFGWIYQAGPGNGKILESLYHEIENAKKEIYIALNDDLNTPEAIRALNAFADRFATAPATEADIPAIKKFSYFVENFLGIPVLVKETLSKEQQAILDERKNVRLAKDWPKADELRAQLQAQGVDVRDTPNGQIWFKT
jgi:cysteinyl-tRNA synthetase